HAPNRHKCLRYSRIAACAPQARGSPHPVYETAFAFSGPGACVNPTASQRSDQPLPPMATAWRGEGGRRGGRYTSFRFFIGGLRTGLPVAARIAFAIAGRTTLMVGSPTPPQKS